MPAPLPPSSAYTYAVELSADEAIAAGAREVRFSAPVVLYVHNFLGFPVGSPVPLGYYDRALGAWVPADDGVVLEIVAESGGAADLDVDGDGFTDTGAALDDLGITLEERQQLAALYEPGQELWRAGVDHFTPWDCNWAWRLPPDALPWPGNFLGLFDLVSPFLQPTDESPCASGCVIESCNQILGERVPIVGTGQESQRDAREGLALRRCAAHRGRDGRVTCSRLWSTRCEPICRPTNQRNSRL